MNKKMMFQAAVLALSLMGVGILNAADATSKPAGEKPSHQMKKKGAKKNMDKNTSAAPAATNNSAAPATTAK